MLILDYNASYEQWMFSTHYFCQDMDMDAYKTRVITLPT